MLSIILIARPDTPSPRTTLRQGFKKFYFCSKPTPGQTAGKSKAVERRAGTEVSGLKKTSGCKSLLWMVDMVTNLINPETIGWQPNRRLFSAFPDATALLILFLKEYVI